MSIWDMADGVMNQSREAFATNGPKYNHAKWKYCVALAERGWDAYDFEPVESETEEETIIKWRKEGEVDIQIRLTFTEQCRWIKYMEKKEQNDKKGKT